MPVPQNPFEVKIQDLVKQGKYRQALDVLKQAKREQPEVALTPGEAEIWLLRGKQEFAKGEFKQAETSLRRSLELGLWGESHYYLAKCLLALNRLDAAMLLIRNAFEQEQLPKEYSLCYPKLLLLEHDVATVEQVLKQYPKRFTAAQKYWLAGVLALKAGQPEIALPAFQKVKQPPIPGDFPEIWPIYTQQIMGSWEAAANQLGLHPQAENFWGLRFSQPAYLRHPMLQRLAYWQHLKTGHPPLENMRFNLDKRLPRDLLKVTTVVELIEGKNYHDAAHAVVELGSRVPSFPELATLRPAILALAGEQAAGQDNLDCAVNFWQILDREQPFNPQLAVNLMRLLHRNSDYSEMQRLLTRLLKWLEQEIKQNPQDWPEQRRKETLAYGHCRLADAWLGLGKGRAALGELEKAERIDPQSPEVIGRRGMMAIAEGDDAQGIALLTQALEQGCRFPDVYEVLIDTLKEQGDPAATLEARRRFGQKFGDLNPETDVEVAPWIMALSTGEYDLFETLVTNKGFQDPALDACQIFVESVQGNPTASGRLELDQQAAIAAWDALLRPLSNEQKVSPLLAISLSVLLFAKRAKGIAQLSNQYLAQLAALGEDQPTAQVAHLVLLALKERDPKKLRAPFQAYLSHQPQPGNALAQIQLQVRRYSEKLSQSDILRGLIDEALQREPQHPLLLLAKATTYPFHQSEYKELKQQGFDLARRLQDAKALQAFREEEAFSREKTIQSILPASNDIEDLDLDDLLERMIRSMIGSDIPPDELRRMLPELKAMMLENMPPMFDDDDDDDDDFDFPAPPFGGLPFPSARPSRRKRR